MIDLTLYFCPECESESSDSDKCTNPYCSYNTNTLIPPHICMIMNIHQQIEQVLRSINRNDLHLPADKYRNSKKSMADIQDGHVYTNILHSLENERQSKFISLTCNIDGTAVYTSSEQSMWTFTACINELKRTIRFSIENIIGCTTPAKIHATLAKSKKITTTYIRIFPTRTNEEPQMRSNDRWHEISHALQNGHVFFTEDKETHSFGYAGESEFTSLAFVDRGTSFMSDTLHTIYHGAFVRTKDFFKIEFRTSFTK
ncbi:unnamed protein product [Rotaria sordida]|uniref:Uncharacterized protein n=1 Tax=Rotaria sordida TaxID=392033 RepID=A0A816CVC3_9BILA|nr:unnamed protein product [Rotaria sordida]CAF1625971.1 unnamed protein product [Rotaria sordida]